MTFATDEEIKIAHDILLKGKKPFDVSRIDIIKENNSCYVQASPEVVKQRHCWPS